MSSNLTRIYKSYRGMEVQDMCVLDLRARMAMDIAKNCSMITAVQNGEDSAGRQRIRLLEPEEVAHRAVRIAAAMYKEFEALDWLGSVPEIPDSEYARRLQEADDEIERLRGLAYAYPPTEFAPDGQTWQQCAEANREEVARLDNLLRTYRLPDEVVDIKVVIELRAEIERLRGENDALKDEVELKQAALTGTSRVMGEEIERLRSQLAAMARGYKSYRDTAEEEFARLRELLRYAVPSGDAPKDWYKRIREALGE